MSPRFRWRRLATFAVLAVLPALIAQSLLLPMAPAGAVLLRDGVQGHRGGAAEQPPNSLAAFAAMIAAGHAEIETDVRYTTDKVPVLVHDDVLPSTCSHAGSVIHTMSYAAVQQVVCNGQPIPSLAEALALIKDSGTTLLLEIKTYAGQSDTSKRTYAKRAAATLLQAGMIGQAGLSTSEWRLLLPTIRSVTTKLPVTVIDKNPSLGGVRAAKAMGAAVYSLNVRHANEFLLTFAKSYGLKILVWATETPAQVKYAVDLGAPLVSTNTPDATAALLAQPDLMASRTTIETTLATPVKVMSATCHAGDKRYPLVIGPAVPASAIPMLRYLTLQVRISGGDGKGSVSIGSRGSRLSDSTRIAMPHGSATVTVHVPPGDAGKLRVYTTSETAKVTIAVLAYTNLAY